MLDTTKLYTINPDGNYECDHCQCGDHDYEPEQVPCCYEEE